MKRTNKDEEIEQKENPEGSETVPNRERIIRLIKKEMSKLDPSVVDLTPPPLMESLIQLFIKTGCVLPKNEDPAYVLFQLDFAALEDRRNLHRGTLQQYYNAHGGPALDGAATASLNAFKTWLDGVILNIPNVYPLQATSFLYRVRNPGPIPDGEENFYHTLAATVVYNNLCQRVPWLTPNYTMLRHGHNNLQTSADPVIVHVFFFAGGNINFITHY